jgi:hypothetical protein
MAEEPSREEKAAARERRLALAPQLPAYEVLENVLWPFVTVTTEPGTSSPVVSIDSRGHRITRVGSETARSDDAPADAGFVLGGSTAFGYGATDDSGTLAAALWRRTGSPYVNLAIPAGNSTQEVVSAMPFADRPTSFVVFSGMNNLMRARGDADGLDPLFGYLFGDRHLRAVASVPLRKLARLVTDPEAAKKKGALLAEAQRRLGERPTYALRSPGEAVSVAAAQQLRDLRLLRRMVPGEATVVFALQPHAFDDRTRSLEEAEILALAQQIRGAQLTALRTHIHACWGDYTSALEQGCAALGVPFLDTGGAAFEGWCFVDPAHLTDRGNDAVAAMLADVVPRAE